jgi:hypothetical protein
VSPAAAADVETRVSSTFDPAHSPARPRNMAGRCPGRRRCGPDLTGRPLTTPRR